jgi:predicted nucleotidyltransferase
MSKTGLTDQQLKFIIDTIQAFLKIEKCIIFGSRANGNFKNSSDIDIALFGKLNLLEGEKIRYELDELPLPYKFDVQVYNEIKNQNLINHINRVGIVIYDKTKKP